MDRANVDAGVDEDRRRLLLGLAALAASAAGPLGAQPAPLADPTSVANLAKVRKRLTDLLLGALPRGPIGQGGVFSSRVTRTRRSRARHS